MNCNADALSRNPVALPLAITNVQNDSSDDTLFSFKTARDRTRTTQFEPEESNIPHASLSAPLLENMEDNAFLTQPIQTPSRHFIFFPKQLQVEPKVVNDKNVDEQTDETDDVENEEELSQEKNDESSSKEK